MTWLDTDELRRQEVLADGIGWIGYPLEPLRLIRARRAPYGVKLPERCGVYFLFLRWALVYVGRTCRPNVRLRQHRDGRAIPFTHVAFVITPMLWHDEIEGEYIRLLRPPFNFALKR